MKEHEIIKRKKVENEYVETVENHSFPRLLAPLFRIRKIVLAVANTVGLVLLLPLVIVLGAVVGSLSMAVSVMFEWLGIIWCDVWRNKE